MNVAGIGSNVLKYGIKAAGIAGIGMCLYDAHDEGKRYAKIRSTRAENDAADFWFENSRNLVTPSKINSKLKDKIFNIEITHNFRKFVNKGIGYVQGFTKSLVEDLIPIGLAVAAVVTKGKVAPKVAGGALGAYAAFAFMKNVLGVGVKQNPL